VGFEILHAAQLQTVEHLLQTGGDVGEVRLRNSRLEISEVGMLDVLEGTILPLLRTRRRSRNRLHFPCSA